MDLPWYLRLVTCKMCGGTFAWSRYYRPAVYCGEACRREARKEYNHRAYAKNGKERQRRSRLKRCLARCEQERG